MTESYADITAALRGAYATSARERDAMAKYDWKLVERQTFLDRLKAVGARRLLEVGAGTGQDSVFFKENGLDVVATDLTPEMVECCREKGLEAYVRDFIDLGFPQGSFDAVHAMNCFLHVPDADLPRALKAIFDVLPPGGLFFLGVYGGNDSEGINEQDEHEPKRFFSFRTDERITAFATECFEMVDFHVVGDGRARFQSLTLRRG